MELIEKGIKTNHNRGGVVLKQKIYNDLKLAGYDISLINNIISEYSFDNEDLPSTSESLTEVSSRSISTPGSVTANSFVKTNGTSSQFLKADGSVDSNTYAVESTIKSYIDSRIMEAVNLVLNAVNI